MLVSNGNWTKLSTNQVVIRKYEPDYSKLYDTKSYYQLIVSITKFVIIQEALLQCEKKTKNEQTLVCLIGCKKEARKNPAKCMWSTCKQLPITGIQFEVVQIGYSHDHVTNRDV